ncbi:phage regulatory protein/antirepressor Ant [uncultured Capnocytophaga sp.]|jgi:anti-repressor protein|uniref:phage regulatory protein/antirepressor Ant n=1 Tax=uncultured Capnocytophaga sp. TaxID=159273 RepID=UPI002057E896|nr:phage regulatory protein/antirepressor Ant [uncultured Capnocytophaga sp.]DAS17098.1 MAG TPA: KilAC domain protein [Caudoviricetes sp.]
MYEITTINKMGQTMSSREIADLTGKRHDHVLRDCDALNENYEKMGFPKIGEGYYTHPNTGNQQHREYRLTKMQTFDLMTGYSAELRIKVNRRWAELEAKEQAHQQIPQSFSEALRLAAEQAEKIEAQQKQLQAQAPKVLFADTVIGSQSSCLIGELAKLITQKGYEIGEKRLFKWLRENHYLGTRGEYYNIPNQQYIEQGLFELKKGTRSGNGGVMHTTITPKVTGKGQVYFVNKFLKTI